MNQPNRFPPRDDPGKPPLAGVAVLIPALNEEESLPGVLALLPVSSLHSVVVVDNGSTDRTAEVAVAGGAVVVREPRRGYGAACLAGMSHLESVDSPPVVLVFLDADHADDPSQMSRVVAPVALGRADLVLGVRVDRGGGEGNVHAHARIGSRVVLVVLRALFGRTFRDMPPFRAIGFEALRELDMDDRDWGWTLQMQIRAWRQGLRILEIEVPHRRRPRGVSKISGSLATSIRVGVKMFYTLLRERARRG